MSRENILEVGAKRGWNMMGTDVNTPIGGGPWNDQSIAVKTTRRGTLKGTRTQPVAP